VRIGLTATTAVLYNRLLLSATHTRVAMKVEYVIGYYASLLLKKKS